MHQKVLSMILVLVMLLGLLSVSAFTTNTTSSGSADSTEFMRIFHLDCGRKYFSVSEIEGIIDQLAANHYTHLQLAFGNNGFRFLLDKMPVGSYTSDQVRSALTSGNETYSNSKGADSSMLSESDMNTIIAYAEKNGISIIPMLNTPGHMDAIVSAMSKLGVGSSRSDSEMSLTDDAQVSFIKALQQKYINYFAEKGSKYYNLAADEYSFSSLDNTKYTAFAKYINDVAGMVKNAGMVPMTFNDGINYSGLTTSVPFDTDILVCYWAQDVNYASVTELSKAGFKIINNNDAWYYVLDDYLNYWAIPQWRYEDALEGIRSTPVTQAKNVADKEVPVVGSVLCVWCDGPDRSYPDNREKVYNLIKAMADANPAYFTDTVKLPETDTTVNEKQTVEIPISIVDYRADGLLFDWTYNPDSQYNNSYRYGLVHGKSMGWGQPGTPAIAKKNVNTGLYEVSGTDSNVEKIARTTIQQTGSDSKSTNFYSNGTDNTWSRAGLVQEQLGANGMPIYTDAAVQYVAGLLSSGYYNAMSGSCNAVLQNTFLVSGASRSVLGTSTTKFSDAFKSAKTYGNIGTAYDLAWYLLNTIYQPDTNMTTVTGTDGNQHNVPIYGMGVDTYSSIVLTDNGDGKYSFNAGYSGNVKKVLYDRTNGTISESSNGQDTTGFYPIDGLGYEQPGLLSKTSAINGGNNNGSFTLRGESQFVYEHDKELYFTFTGDDDVYMYINGKLALDLGGAHGRNTKTVKLNDLNAEYGLEEGQVATFTFFYMERCSDASTFGIETNMELVKRGISVQKNAYDAGYANEIMSDTAVETGRSVYYDLVVTNQSNALMNHICFNDTDDRGGTASFGYGVANAAVTAGTTKTDGTVSLGAAGTYEIYVTDANNAEVAGTRRTFGSLSDLSAEVAAIALQPGQSLHVRFLTATFAVDKSKILNYVNTVRVSAAVGSQQLSDEATNELYSYNANDTSRTYVVDFGLPLQITGIFDSGAKENIGNVKLNDSNTLKYGTVNLTPNGYYSSLVYTRTDDKAINDAETIVLDVTYKMGSSNVTLQKTLTIIPATNVYYEDSFAKFTNADSTKDVAQGDNADKGIWTKVTDGTTQTNVNQALEELGGTTNTKNVYGYDPAYAASSKFSMGSATKVTVDANTANNGQWPTATFTFRGTGFDVISLTDNNSGAIAVDIYKSTGERVKGYVVNNYYGYTYNEATRTWEVNNSTQDNALYQIPVMKVNGLTYGEYTVKISVEYDSFFDKTGDGQYSFWLDAIRVYDPMDKNNVTYTQDNEGYPQYIKLRDEISKDGSPVTANVLFIDGGPEADVDTYKNYGPNNEVYLAENQAIAFNVPGGSNIASIQIGAKAPNGSAAQMVVNQDNPRDIQSATEMYYKIGTDGGNFTITNTGNGILSLTNLKITYTASGGSVSLARLTTADQANAVAQVRALFAAPAEPFQPDRFKASWGHAVRKGDTATLTVKASEDVESITVDGQTITAYATKTERTGWGWWAKTVTYREFTYQVAAEETTDYTICAVNSAGVSSDPITATLTVRPSVRDWWHGIFDKWF